jgi:PKHD-type hydroxylase
VKVLAFDDVLALEPAARLRSLLNAGSPLVQQAAAELVQRLRDHPLVGPGLLPRRFSAPVFRRHEAGLGTTPVVGDAIVRHECDIRVDVGIIVGLSDPSEYEGGDVLIDTGSGEERITIGVGSCVLYPASARCGIAPITRGVRWTAELQAQSFVRGAEEREILYDIGYSLHLLRLFGPAEDPNVARLEACSRNLLRILAEC